MNPFNFRVLVKVARNVRTPGRRADVPVGLPASANRGEQAMADSPHVFRFEQMFQDLLLKLRAKKAAADLDRENRSWLSHHTDEYRAYQRRRGQQPAIREARRLYSQARRDRLKASKTPKTSG